MADDDFALTSEPVHRELKPRPGTILVWATPRDRGWCGADPRRPGCGQPITWMRTYPAGRPIPITGSPKPEQITIDPSTTKQVWALRAEAAHFVTCPKATNFKKGRP